MILNRNNIRFKNMIDRYAPSPKNSGSQSLGTAPQPLFDSILQFKLLKIQIENTSFD